MNKLLILFIFSCQIAWGQSSVFAKGKWIKIGVSQEGVYKLDQAFFKKYVSKYKEYNPAKIGVYMGQVGVLPQANASERVFDLKPVPVLNTDNNQFWDSADALYFYAPSAHSVFLDATTSEFQHQINPYSDSTYLFVCLDCESTNKMSEVLYQKQSNAAIDKGEFYTFFEKEQKNVLNSGRLWLGDFFYNFLEQSFDFPELDMSQPLAISLMVLGVGRADQTMTISLNSQPFKEELLPGSSYNPTNSLARYNRYSNLQKFKYQINPEGDKLTIKYGLKTANSANAGAYIDYVSFNGKQFLADLNTKQQFSYFRKQDLVSNSNFKVKGINANTRIWSVGNPFLVKNLALNSLTGDAEFSLNFDADYAKVVVFNLASVPNPSFVKTLENQDIKSNISPQLLVVYPLKFKSQVERFVLHKKTKMDVEALAVTTEQIYNEFSSGKVDPSAIRDACRYFFNKSPGKLTAVLLFGDGSFDYKNNDDFSFININNLVPSYQSRESLEPIYSYSSDDFYGFMEPHEGEWAEGFSVDGYWRSNQTNDHTLDIAVGRLPVKSVLEAKSVVDKIIAYETSTENTNIWKRKLTFVADNRDFNIHQRDAEKLSDLVLDNFGGYEVSKIYLDDFPAEGEGLAAVSPLATAKLNKAIESGSFLVNYNGHGAEDGWAQEKLLTLGSINSWNNNPRLPIFFTATCQFGKFDNPAIVSGAELAILRQNQGAIALLTTTRPVYSSTNERINTAFYQNLQKFNTLGEVFLKTKNASIQGEINRNFSLLGDPSLRLPIFNDKVKITSIKIAGKEASEAKPTNKVNVTGEVSEFDNGRVLVSVFSPPINKKTLGIYDDGPSFAYLQKDLKISETVLEVKNGKFSGEFVIPKEVSAGVASIKLFGIDADSVRQIYGSFSGLNISSDANPAVTDTQAPQVNFTLVKDNVLLFDLLDQSGFNFGLVNPAYAMKLIIDDSTSISALPYFYLVKENNQGQINYFVGNLSEGKHTVSLIVYDTHNNKYEETFEFNISKPKLEIASFLNYPNPFTDFTNLVFLHNRKGDNLSGQLWIGDLSGKKILEKDLNCENCNAKVEFGVDFEGDTYINTPLFFRFVLKSLSDGSKSEASGKMIFWK
jgi:hypothetical protein